MPSKVKSYPLSGKKKKKKQFLMGGLDGKEFACNVGDPGSIPESERFLWKREWLPSPVFLPGKIHGQRILAGYSLCGWVTKRWIPLNNKHFNFH